MNLVRRTIERKSRRGIRYKYLILPNKLSVLFNDGEEPAKIVVVLTHRRRRYECNARDLETATTGNSHKRVVEWPQANADNIHFNVTFFKLPNSDQFDDKEWTVAIESRDEKGGGRPLAGTSLNLQNLAGRSLEMTLRLRPAADSLCADCQLTLTFISSMLRGFACFAATDDNLTMYSGAAVIRMPTGPAADLPSPAEGPPVEERPDSNGAVRVNCAHTFERDSIRFSTISGGSVSEVKQSTKSNRTDDSDAEPTPACRRPSPPLKSDDDEKDDKWRRRSTTTDDATKRLSSSANNAASRPSSAADSCQPSAEERRPSPVAAVPQVEAPSVSKVIEELELMTQRKKEELQRFQQEEEEERAARQLETDRQQRLREEARRLMRDALQSTVAGGAAAAGQQQRSFMVRSAVHANSASLRSSQIDLRTLDFVTPNFSFRQFSLRQPSPFLQRKNICESPLLPSFGLSTSMTKTMATVTTTTDEDDVGADASTGGADASDETRLVYEDERHESRDESEHEMRKITSRFEQEMQNPASKIQEDLDEIADRIAEVERLDTYVVSHKMKSTEPGSAEEQKFIEQHLRYLTEKEALVRQQDYLNVVIELKETADKIEELQRLINQSTADEPLHAETLIIELKTLIDKKDELSHILIDKETEEEEEKERGKLLVQQSQSFVRGTVEPLSASKRILTWFNSPRNTAAN